MDPVHFTGREVLDMAIRIEENGMRYYADAGKASASKEVKKLFRALAEDEAGHIKVFTGLRDLASGNDYAAFGPYVEEASMYLKALADTEVFTSPEEGEKLATAVRDEKEVLNVAIVMEKDSLLFYYELLRMIRERDRVVVERLIEQEKEHLSRLTGLLKTLYARP